MKTLIIKLVGNTKNSKYRPKNTDRLDFIIVYKYKMFTFHRIKDTQILCCIKEITFLHHQFFYVKLQNAHICTKYYQTLLLE